MPMLPWLPASRKKRFPVTKRSPKALTPPATNEKVSQDLKGIFGATENQKNGDSESKKKKRSSDDSHALMADNSMKDEKSKVMHEHGNMHVHEAQKKQKRNASDPDDDEDVDNDNGMRINTRHLDTR